MSRRVMLLRGVNVGGAHRLRMADLAALVERLGGRDAACVIQSGNVVFSGGGDAAAFAGAVAREIERAHGFRPRALVIEAGDFAEIVAGFPFAEARAAPATGHLWFLAGPASPDVEAMAALAGARERFALTARAFCLHAPDGIGRSKLAARAEPLLGVAATARNLATCGKLVAMLGR